MRKFLLLALIATTFFACTKQEEFIDNNNAGKTSLSVKIDFSTFKTRSGDDSIKVLPNWDNLLLVAKNGAETREILISRTSIPSDGVIQIFEKETVNFDGGTVEAYIVTDSSDWGPLTALPTVNLPILAAGQTNINNWQPSGFITTGVSGKFVNVPYYGSGAITDNGPGVDGHHQLVATVSVVPELGRIQVLHTPQINGEKNNYKVTSIVVTNIYINNIKSEGGRIDIRTQNSYQNVETGEWISKFYAPTKPLVGMTDDGTDKGYQIFDASTPHVIVKIDYQLDGKTDKTYSGYLTLTKFSYTGVTSGDLTVEKGKVYSIDLSKLKPAYDQIGDEPYDNTTYYDLTATVTVQDWTKVDVTPEL